MSPLHCASQLALQLAIILTVGFRAEQLVLPSGPRVGYALAAAVLVSGATVSFGSLMAYLSTTEEAYLYKPLWGAGPVAAALAVAAHQVRACSRRDRLLNAALMCPDIVRM
jgi:hypothetical protein